MTTLSHRSIGRRTNRHWSNESDTFNRSGFHFNCVAQQQRYCWFLFWEASALRYFFCYFIFTMNQCDQTYNRNCRREKNMKRNKKCTQSNNNKKKNARVCLYSITAAHVIVCWALPWPCALINQDNELNCYDCGNEERNLAITQWTRTEREKRVEITERSEKIKSKIAEINVVDV